MNLYGILKIVNLGEIFVLTKMLGLTNASINVKPEGGDRARAYVGHLTFQKSFWSKSPPWGPKIASNQIKYPHLGEVISLKFIVVVVYILQNIDINCQAFLLIPLMLCVIQ